MIRTYDVGSIPFPGDIDRFEQGAATHPLVGLLHPEHGDARRYFTTHVVNSLIDKIRTGLSVPNYPQFRDMNTMFLDNLRGIVKTSRGYDVVDRITLAPENATIPELAEIEAQSRTIVERVGAPCAIKLCVTGPYTLASLFAHRRDTLLAELSAVISAYITANVLHTPDVTTRLVSVDEPVFGFIDDPLLDHGRPGREALLHAWEDVFQAARVQGAQTVLHLHNTRNELFWHVDPVDVLESHVHDPLYTSPRTKTLLDQHDASLKASIAVTNFDELIRTALAARGVVEDLPAAIGATWTHLRDGRVDPVGFVDSVHTIADRLRRIVAVFGDRVTYAGPECGLRSFPSYESALECLRRVTNAVNVVAQS